MKERRLSFGRGLNNIRRTLANLAAPANKQLEYLKGIGDERKSMDELALEFHDDHLCFRQFISKGLITPAAAKAVSAVDRLLDGMSGEGNSSLWTAQALSSSPEWVEVRKRATAALALLSAERSRWNR